MEELSAGDRRGDSGEQTADRCEHWLNQLEIEQIFTVGETAFEKHMKGKLINEDLNW